MPITIWSSGGGVQSAALAALIVRGDISKPDLAAIVDTGYEASSTWAYHDSVIVPALARAGVTLHRVASRDYRTVGLWSGNGDLLIPAFTETGKLPTFCSTEWKRRSLQRWAREQRPGTDCFEVWLGISLDEARRVKPTDKPWLTRYPLIEKGLRRHNCRGLVAEMGWPAPPRSSCWMCPNHTAAEWTALKADAPDDFAKACAFEDDIRAEDDFWLTKTRKPLREWDGDSQPDLWTGLCDSGYCYV